MLRDFKPRARRGARDTERRAHFARRACALLTAAALLHLSGSNATAAAARRPAPTGQVGLAAGLTIDGSPAVSGQTIFPGSIFVTGESARAALELGNLARLELSGGSDLKLDFTDAGVVGALGAGGARVSVPREVATSLTTADASVVNDDAEPALFSLQVSAEGTTLTVQAGRVEMRAGGVARMAVAGESLRAAHGSAPEMPQGQNLSGKKKAGIFVGIAAAVAAVILVLTGRGDDEGSFGGVICPLLISPGGPLPPGC